MFRQPANDGQIASRAIDKVQDAACKCRGQASRSIRASNVEIKMRHPRPLCPRRMFAACPTVASVVACRGLGSLSVGRGMLLALWTLQLQALAGPAGCPG
ncbi:unnamed protein product [Symbiodinium natans]|uniref:Uncharacterized protein n=1 Tax=Symbiodinium natans TaxID=878477 RepID=A0A812I797_9DINO|nr:unnamed protein product [Symbiodinium natans]